MSFSPFVVAICVAVLLAGCGGSASRSASSDISPPASTSSAASTSTGTTTRAPATRPARRPSVPTHSEFVGRLDQICQADSAAVKPHEQQFNADLAAGSYAAAAEAAQQGLAAASSHGDPTRLTPPPEDRYPYQDYVRSYRRLQQSITSLIAALETGNTTQAVVLAKTAAQAQAARATAANELGSTSCGM